MASEDKPWIEIYEQDTLGEKPRMKIGYQIAAAGVLVIIGVVSYYAFMEVLFGEDRDSRR